MIIVGEKINGTLKAVQAAILERDAAFIAELARRQAEAGADYLDVNAGTAPGREEEDLKWLVEVVQEVVDTPLCLDSPRPETLAAVLPQVRRPGGLLNSVTAEPGKPGKVFPLAAEYRFGVVSLTIDERGIPKDVETRVDIASRLIEEAGKYGLREEYIYVDPLVTTLATASTSGKMFVEAVREIKGRFPEVHVISGLSNVSFGLPLRRTLNRTFLVLAREAGMDAAIVDPLDDELMVTIQATELLLGEDPYCRRYLQYCRSRKARV
ncbi:methyltetrahydrofolate cobalamin methyltransferase [Moorella sp. Hama-1]|uniref:methyltetrahydrofolate cobalamin methyltransferase n=1 Tax=Moorella sp. Hama-1 TaxID=2138101 RepID=UPI000D642F74|nr:methyltetrahydrofolate cobalamin methyltransferase [Moorella sp. Hama-1]BCV22378.1 methyltetrahydrofolate--corrinoid methyltransferase [Moorella sp. Hama-1]